MQGENIFDDVKSFSKKVIKKIDSSFRQRNSSVYPPDVRNFLTSHSNEKIDSLKVVRTPISSFVKTLLNIISLGSFDEAIKKSPYDSMFHLALFINNRYTLDKQDVVKLSKSNCIKKDSQVLDINMDGKSITINELLDKTKSLMGNSKFNRYDARKNNCQHFIIEVLKSNDLLNTQLESFIKQDSEQIFKKMPVFSEKIGKVLTDISAVGDKILQGENYKKTVNKKMKTLKWKEYISKEMKGKRFHGRESVNNYLKELATKYKELKKENNNKKDDSTTSSSENDE